MWPQKTSQHDIKRINIKLYSRAMSKTNGCPLSLIELFPLQGTREVVYFIEAAPETMTARPPARRSSGTSESYPVAWAGED